MNKNFIFLLLAAILIFGCSDNDLNIDISEVKIQPIKVLRLEKDLFALTSDNIVSKTENLKVIYGNYYDHYLSFLNRRGTNDLLYAPSVLSFIKDQDIIESYNYIKVLFPDSKIQNLAKEMNDCVKRFHYHFPKRKLPNKLITVMSGWNYAFAYTDSALVVSLDMYLNDTAKFYQMLRYPLYQAKKMNENYILSDVARGWLLTEFDNGVPINTLLNHSIFYGKIFYAVNALLPDQADSMTIGYTTPQMAYCKAYEKNVWGYFADQNRLFENNMQTIRELTSDGPFTGAISKECPPRIAMWIGWQIIKSYMKNNKGVTLEQLMTEKDAQKILNKSKYRP